MSQILRVEGDRVFYSTYSKEHPEMSIDISTLAQALSGIARETTLHNLSRDPGIATLNDDELEAVHAYFASYFLIVNDSAKRRANPRTHNLARELNSLELRLSGSR